MPIELDRGHDEPIFGPDGPPDFAARLDAATAMALPFGREARMRARRLDHELRDQLAAYVVGRSTLDHFAQWFRSVELIAKNGVNPSAHVLADMIGARLVDHADGHVDEAHLRHSLAAHAFFQVERDPAITPVWTASATRTVRSPLVAVPT